jgi:hypothetical protein
MFGGREETVAEVSTYGFLFFAILLGTTMC